ncbi:hypothetical protein [Hasllibacter sp. MH4015]|uniref:hypothetical protein n=1 Tax=Hasllibacter sp. MH4015 TaxID=2854029 RepID=UPI001CD60F4F|nr:hypothetical protein [Hasllibacter sp. MH4015]
MPDTSAVLDPRRACLQRLSRIGAAHGFFQRLDRRHTALFVQEGDTLVLSFDRLDRIWSDGDAGLPMGFDAVLAHEFSLLTLMAAGRTWFRGAQVAAFLQTLADQGFFESFARVLILGSGPDCGHAAARAAQYVPGASVMLSRPVAAIGPRHAPFETRFIGDRLDNPDDPPPLGPDAMAGADQSFVLFDSASAMEAAQAALFRAPGTTRVDLPHVGDALDRAMQNGAVLAPLLRHLARGDLTPALIREILRKHLRRDPAYLARLAMAAERAGHDNLASRIRDAARAT